MRAIEQNECYGVKSLSLKVVSDKRGLEKSPVQLLGQVDFRVGQVTFHTHLPDGQGYGQAAR